jgi:hypothetical protein
MVLALVAVLPFGAAQAALKASAPKGVDLSGRWKLSPELSEDPHAAVSVAREEMNEQEQKDKGKKKRRSKGSVIRPASDKSRMPSGGEGMPPREPADSPDDSAHEAEEPKKSTPPDSTDPLERAVTTPEEFAIQQEPEAFVLMLADATDTCKTRQPGEVNVPGYGLTPRKCGWDKAGFVVETQPKNGPLNMTRYEMDKENGRLLVTSELKGERIPKISVKRVYVRVESGD